VGKFIYKTTLKTRDDVSGGRDMALGNDTVRSGTPRIQDAGKIGGNAGFDEFPAGVPPSIHDTIVEICFAVRRGSCRRSG
jgi:hypothetical protein